jgi:carboxypeptidase Taq
MGALLARLADIQNLNRAAAVLEWDQRTYMPGKGSEARSRQIATMAKLAHDLFVAQQTQDLLASAEATRPAAGSNEGAILRVTRRDLDKATKVPTSLVVAMAETCARAQDIWQEARAANDYPTFAPWLDRIIDLKRQYAAAVAPGVPIYDALLDDYEEGMTCAQLDPLFQTLRDHTVPLLSAIQSRGKPNSDKLLTRGYDAAGQQAFSTFILKDCGFPSDRGRLDVSVHPFCTNFSRNDVRITTRYETDWLPGALFGCLHEMGHAFYELNVDPAFEDTPLSGGVSLGVHESQSRLWENLVGRSREFWSRYYPKLQVQFPGQLGSTGFDEFYRAINNVTPSLIRVEADELTYNLHIILRYEMEKALLTGELSVSDAPEAWNQRMHAYLGVVPPSNREGILQDVHWSGGGMGYFPTYTLGNVLAAQLFESAERAIPGLRAGFAAGDFGLLYRWLQTHVHRHGRKYPPRELITLATGKPLGTEAYLRYLTGKFSAIYEL